jgi:hypothetical protein
MLARGGGGPRLWYEDNLNAFPLCREVGFEQDCIEQLWKILYSNTGQFFEDFAGDEVIFWRYFGFGQFMTS